MNSVGLNEFVAHIMSINATMPGVGSASTGVWGTTGAGDQTIIRLKKDTIMFAEVFKNSTVKAKLLSNDISGSLMTLQVLGGISQHTLDQLLDSLNALMTKLTKV